MGAIGFGPQLFRGSVPEMNAIMTGLAQVPAIERSTGTNTTPSGIGKSSTGEPCSASFMNAVQMGTATRRKPSRFGCGAGLEYRGVSEGLVNTAGRFKNHLIHERAEA